MKLEEENLVVEPRVYYRIYRIGFPIALVLCVVLLAVCIAFAVLYTQAVNKHAIPTEQPAKKYEICTDDRCFELGKAIVRNMNQSVNPCHDFYRYACGGWQRRHPMTGNKTISVSNELRAKNLQVLKKALEEASLNYSKNAAVMKTARFYNSCVNTTAITSLGLLPLINLIAKYGGWSVSNNYNPNVSIATRIGRAARELNVDSLVAVRTARDSYNNSNTILQLGRANIPDLKAYRNINDQDLKKVLDKYKKTLKTLGRIFGGKDADEKMLAIFDFGLKLLKIASGKTLDEELIESIKESVREETPIVDHRMTIKQFCNQTGFSCSFLMEILQIVYGRSFSGAEKLMEPNVMYYKQLYTLYEETVSAGNASVVADYIMLVVIFEYLKALPPQYSDKITGASTPPTPRWKKCIASMFSTLDMPLALLYVNADFDDNSKETVQEMTNDIRASFIERLPKQTWMDSETQRKAKEKALAIKVSIGYPPYIKNTTILEDHYKSINVTDDFFTNFVAMKHFVRMLNVNAYGKPVEKDNDWPVNPSVVNAFYNPMENRIIYLAGIIQPPFYSVEYPRYMNYGGLGTVIGHEITHGFDGTGRLFDKDGDLLNWWSDSADANFKDKSSCLVKQYNEYQLFDLKMNGSNTLDENIADNGGIKIAYDAYQRWTAQNGTEKILPGLDLNPDQLFFVGYAQLDCSVYSRKSVLQEIKTDTHSTGRFRVIGSLSNFDKFSQAFHCPANSPMNPSTKCALW